MVTVPRMSPFDAQGSIGRHFTASSLPAPSYFIKIRREPAVGSSILILCPQTDGVIGGTADKVGGPFSKEGVVGRQFTETGSVGGTVQDGLGGIDDPRARR
jgi:hypothetical protein